MASAPHTVVGPREQLAQNRLGTVHTLPPTTRQNAPRPALPRAMFQDLKSAGFCPFRQMTGALHTMTGALGKYHIRTDLSQRTLSRPRCTRAHRKRIAPNPRKVGSGEEPFYGTNDQSRSQTTLATTIETCPLATILHGLFGTYNPLPKEPRYVMVSPTHPPQTTHSLQASTP